MHVHNRATILGTVPRREPDIDVPRRYKSGRKRARVLDAADGHDRHRINGLGTKASRKGAAEDHEKFHRWAVCPRDAASAMGVAIKKPRSLSKNLGMALGPAAAPLAAVSQASNSAAGCTGVSLARSTRAVRPGLP